jgi:hypothetical protein
MLLAVLCAAGMCQATGGVGAARTLGEVRRVYILPMQNGLDLMLATELTRRGLFQVVTEPAAADAVLSDSIGQAFETRMAQLYPPPPAHAKAEAEAKPKDEEPAPEISLKKAETPRISAFSRGKGTVFLVDRGSREVLWAVYERPRTASPDEIHRTAARIAGALEKTLKPGASGSPRGDK